MRLTWSFENDGCVAAEHDDPVLLTPKAFHNKAQGCRTSGYPG